MVITESFKSLNMTVRLYRVFLFLVLIFTSCKSQTTVKQNTDTSNSVSDNLSIHEPNFNYKVEVPKDWTVYDTLMQGGLKIRLIFSSKKSQADFPAGNILISWMDGNNIEDFRENNIKYLKANSPDITILNKGNIESTEYGGQWFTYTKIQDGVVRDMVNYIIPFDGFAYMITCGCNKGTMYKYRTTFDKIARSFKF